MAFLGAALAGVLALRLADGSASALVQQWYIPVLVVTSLVLFALAGHAAWRCWRDGVNVRAGWSFRSAMGFGVIGVPVLVAAVYQPSPLGSANLENAATTAGTRFSESARSTGGERNVYQWAYQFETAPMEELSGQEFVSIGFVYHHPEGAEGTFDLARFVVACCVADATGFTLPIQWADAAELESDSWVRVEGQVAAGPDGGPIVVAKTVERIEQPSNPYIYP